MKRIIIIVIFLFLSLNLYPQFNKVETDKILHFTTSYVITDISYHFLEKKTSKNKALIYSTLIGISAGITKEIIDHKYGAGAQNGDLIADGLGIGFSIIIIKF